ncbi:hypothetical protein FGO68_gene10067 [Halteria grandinella]|uniref:Uncharacterized protein n=1 Tax=Halteria grandinella TaxID=5974 RepID=A0A8J8NJB6_HALGN|nr:hypothetical protein FGO68_gene10067 [Halteria grandinella]
MSIYKSILINPILRMGATQSIDASSMALPDALISPKLQIFLAASLFIAGLFSSLKEAVDYTEQESDDCGTCCAGTTPPAGAMKFHDEHLLKRKRFGGAQTVTQQDYPIIARLIQTVPCHSGVSVPIGCSRELVKVDGGNEYLYTIRYTTIKATNQTRVLMAYKYDK